MANHHQPSAQLLPAPGRPWRRSAAWLAFLGPFFFLTYGFANWWTARLPHVGAVVFGWERHIPFWAWTILPYMSLDAFYAGSLFLCATRAELDSHAKRLLTASVLSVAGFLLFPLRFSFERPATSGFNGALFTALAGFDKPYNQAPSLHISLALLVWLVYARYLRGAARYAAHGWFLLIAVSVFTTYQHHFIDGVAGAAVGVLCVYLFPDKPQLWAGGVVSRTHLRLASAYGLVAALCLGLAAGLGGWAWLLLWPAGALLLVGLAYAQASTVVFQKHAGRLSWAARTLLAPYLLGAWWSSRWLTRRTTASVEVAPGIWLGRAPGRADQLSQYHASVLDLTAEFSLGPLAEVRSYRNVPLLDLVAPSAAELAQAVAALNALAAHPPVLVHCALGYSRAAVVVAAWLLHHGAATSVAEALAQVRAVRPWVVLTPAHCAALAEYRAAYCFTTILL